MAKEDILKIASNPNFISGIYNYCDRWCDRCPLTSSCMLYAMEQQEQRDPNGRDASNSAFWENLRDVFQQTLDMVQKLAEEEGVDLDSLEVDSDLENEKRLRENAENHTLAKAALRYSNMVENWFESEEELFAEKELELNSKLDWGIDSSELNSEAKSIVDAVEIILWYQNQIYVKLMRGLMREEYGDPKRKGHFSKDSDGSVKVALIGIDRSIGAWGLLHSHFPEKTDNVLSILLILDRLRAAAEKEFPRARSFQRPGFDTLPT